jgi:glycosyltransferase involved in cell wall biosynthesis
MEYRASILVSLCNRPDWLRELLEHFSRQSFDMRQVEVILVDDSGPANYHRQQAVIEEVRGKYPFAIKYFTTGLPEEVYGNPVARNIGLRNAVSPLIISTDDDCLPHFNFVAEHVKMHGRRRGLMVAGVRVNDIAKLAQPLPVEIDDEKSRRYLEKQRRGELGAGAFLGHNISVRKEDLEWVGGWNEKMANAFEYGYTDRELGMRLLGHGLKFMMTPDAIVYHRPVEKKVADFRKAHNSTEKAHKRFKRIQRLYKTKRVLSAPLLLLPHIGQRLVRNILRP